MNKTLIIVLLIVLSTPLLAQYSLPEEEPEEIIPWNQRFRFGGGLGLSFGNITMVDISPRVSYMLHPRWFVGVGGSYLYYKNNYYNYNTSIYGVSAFTNYAIIDDLSSILPFGDNAGSLIFYAEASAINMDPEMDFTQIRNERFWLWQPLAGAGLKIPAGRRSYALILFLYNFNEKLYSPTRNPVISVSLMF